MKTKLFFLPVFIVCGGQFLQAQSGKLKRIKMSSIYAQFGVMPVLPNASTINDFQTLAPNSDIISRMSKNNLTNNDFYPSIGGTFGAMCSFKFANKARSKYNENREFRLGISNVSGVSKSMNSNTQTSQPVDTITSTQTGRSYITDSVVNKYYTLDYRNTQLRIDGSFIIRTNPNARWNLYAGIGVTHGITLNALTTLNERIYSYHQIDGSRTSNYYDGSVNRTELYSNKKSFNGSVYFPFGFDFRLGKTKEPWSKTYLHLEMRPSVQFTNVPELGIYIYEALQTSLGFRIVI